MIMGQIGEYRELSLQELRNRFGQEARDIQALELQAKKERAKPIAEMFAEALGNLEDALCCLTRINEQYEEYQARYSDDIRLVTEYGLRHCNPELDFWLQTEKAEDSLGDMLYKLQRLRIPAPQEKDAP